MTTRHLEGAHLGHGGFGSSLRQVCTGWVLTVPPEVLLMAKAMVAIKADTSSLNFKLSNVKQQLSENNIYPR